MDLSLVKTVQGLSELEADWSALCDRCDRYHYNQTFPYAFGAWKEFYQNGSGELAVVVGRDQGRLVLIFPMVVFHRLFWRLGKILSAGPYNNYTDLLIDPSLDQLDSAKKAWSYIKKVVSADLFDLGYVSDDSILVQVIKQSNYKVVAGNDVLRMPLCGHPDWDSLYNQTHSSRFRRERRRCYRRLAEKGDIEIVQVHTESEMAQAFDWIAKHKSDWGVRHGKVVNYAFSPNFRQWSIGLFDPGLAQKILFVRLLKVGDRIVAASYSAICGKVMQLIFVTYDHDWKQYGPGNILEEADYKWAFDKGFHELDFGPGIQGYKLAWTDKSVPIKGYLVPDSLVGRCISFYKTFFVFLRTIFYRLPYFVRSAITKQLSKGQAVEKGSQLPSKTGTRSSNEE